MNIYYSKYYNIVKHDFDTTRKANVIAEKIGLDNLMSPDYFLGMAGWLIERYVDGRYLLALRTGDPVELAESNGLEWCKDMFTMTKYNTAGVVAAADSAMSTNGISGSLSSGLHHASYERGAGFCTINSLAIAAFNALRGDRYSVNKVLILDFDAHNGGGTVDMIRRNQFAKNIHQIDLSTSTFDEYEQSVNHKIYYEHDDDSYIARVDSILKESRISSGNYCLVLYNAGVDPYPEISREALALRDKMVFEYCRKHNVPCAFTLAGGYTDTQDMDELAETHINTLRAAEEAMKPPEERSAPEPTPVVKSSSRYQDIVIHMDSVNEDALFADGLEDAVIGYTRTLSTGKDVVVYSAEKVIEVLMRDGMSYEEAIEYADFNIFCAYMGEDTPLFMWEFPE
jgi:acetoin utilization deacetylase AcuC-like enzyme